MSSIKISCLRTIIHVTFSFGTNCPKLFPSNMARAVYPPSPHIVQNSRELSVKGASHRRISADCPWLAAPAVLFSGGAAGVYPPEPHPFPWLGKGGGIGLNMNGGLLMNFTNSPYERMMKEIPHKEAPASQKAPEGTPCSGCPYWQGIACVFCYREHLKKQGWCVNI